MKLKIDVFLQGSENSESGWNILMGETQSGSKYDYRGSKQKL